ncbi:MAG: hypothetical protein ACE5JX_12925 [Acidobacteriota bacterium]
MSMTWHYWYHMWTTGTYTVSVDIPLDWTKNYLVTGYLTQTDGDDYAHVYISTVCHYSGGDVVSCGVRDIGDDKSLNVVEPINNANKVTITLKTKGGRHRAEGIVYQV